MELMVSIAILVMITSTLFNILAWLFSEWEKWKEQLNLRSEVIWMVEVLTNHIKNWEEIKIIDSELNNKNFNWLLIKNANWKYKDSLFTIIKPLEEELTERELPTFPWEKNYFLWITDDNLFVDIEYSSDFWLIISNPWSWQILQIKNWGAPTVLLWWGTSDLFTPTGLYLWTEHLYISDTYANKIYRISRTNLAKTGQNARNIELKLFAWSWSWNTMWFQDWSLWASKLNKPKWLTIANQRLYIVDSGNNAVRSISLIETDAEIDTYIWNWKKWLTEDDYIHEKFLLNNPTDIEFDDENQMLLLSDTNNNRIIAFWPKEWDNEYEKPYTIAWLWIKKDDKQGAWGLAYSFDKSKINNVDNYETVLNQKEIWKAWFSWDYSLANMAQLHHPTWIKSLWKNAFVFSDSWNNLIREVVTYDFWQCNITNPRTWDVEQKLNCEIKLKDWSNLIRTVIWNSTEIKLWNFNWNTVFKSLKAPVWANDEWVLWELKTARLNVPMWIEYWNWSIYFTDNIISTGSSPLFSKLNTASWITASFSWTLLFNEDFKIKTLDIDKINIWKIEDFISTSPINLLLFENKTNIENINPNENKSQSLIKLYLRAVSYLKEWEPIETEIETSISPRKIIPKY